MGRIYLSHVVELGDSAEKVHGSLPLLVVHRAQISISEKVHQGMDMTLAREVESGPDVTERRGNSLGSSWIQSSRILVFNGIHNTSVKIVPNLFQQGSTHSLSDADLVLLLDTVLLKLIVFQKY